MSREKFIYNPRVVATNRDYVESIEKFEKICHDAPKVTDYPDRDVVVAHKFVSKGETINATSLADLISKLGINPAPKNDANSSNEENTSSISINKN